MAKESDKQPLLGQHQRRRSTLNRPYDSFDHGLDSNNNNDDDESRSNSLVSNLNPNINNSTYRDLRSYDPHNLPSTRRRSSIRRSSSSGESPTLPVHQPLHASPSYAERWVHRQSKMGKNDDIYSNRHANSSSSRIDMNQLERDIEVAGHHESSASAAAAAAAAAAIVEDEDRSQFDSKPSSRRSSAASSLDDVCFPLEVLATDEEGRQWPDLKVLDEFYAEETARLKDEVLRETSHANFMFEQARDQDKDEVASRTSNDTSTGGHIGFSNPIITKVDAAPSHLLGNQKINETETLNGRLRPPKINPFDKKRLNNADFLKTINYPPHIINNNPEHFRFTYFRENLDSTIHSPTISGLLQPGQSFAEIFDPTQYSKDQPTTANPTAHASTSNSFRESTPLSTLDALKSESNLESLELSSLNRTSPFWLDVLNPTEEEMKVLSKAFQIHPLTTEDIFLGEIREKVELFKDYYFVCFRSFDIVHERKKRRRQFATNAVISNTNSSEFNDDVNATSKKNSKSGVFSQWFNPKRRQSSAKSITSTSSSMKKKIKQLELEQYKKKSGDRHKPKNDELEPLNVYILVFKDAVITFHFAPTPHPVNVRRRARLLREYLTVSADWIAYALIDDITDAFGPMIESIEDEVNDIEDAILKMNDSDSSSDDESDSDDDYNDLDNVQNDAYSFKRKNSTFNSEIRSVKSVSSSSTRSTSSNTLEWRKKGDMLKRIGESRKRVMSLSRLLGSKVDVIKGFAKRCNEQWEVAPRSEIGMYLGDIQDHIVTMVQSLNHYEKLLARSHSNYLAQINIDMTRVNNDMNDVLGKISILGTVVLPMNIVTGLWGMNVLVPGQEYDGLMWFWGIASGMCLFAFCCYVYAKRVSGFD